MLHPIQLDKMRNLKYGMRAVSLIEKHFKKQFGAIDASTLTMSEIAVYVWAGLQHEDKSLTVDKVMDLVDDYSDFGTVLEIVGEAVSTVFGKSAKNSEDKEDPEEVPKKNE